MEKIPSNEQENIRLEGEAPFLAPLPLVKSSYKPPLYMRVIRTIVAIIKKVFKCLFLFWIRKKKVRWSPREVVALARLKNGEIEVIKSNFLGRRSSRLELQAQRLDVENEEASVNDNKHNSLYASREFEPSLEAARQWTREFVGHIIEVVFEETISPRMENRYRLVDEFTSIIKFFSEMMLKLGDHEKDRLMMDQINHKLEALLLNKLPEIVFNLLKSNAEKITDEITGRIAELLEKIDLKDAIDRISYLVHNHIKDYIKAKEKILARLQAAEIEPHTPEAIDEYVESETPLSFASLPSVHETLKDRVFGCGERHDKLLWERLVTKRSIAARTNAMVDLIFPTITIETEDEVKELDGISLLWDLIEFPDEFKSLLGEIEDFIYQFLPIEEAQANRIIESIRQNTREIVVAIGNVKIKKIVADSFYKLYEALIPPENLSKVLAGYILPGIFDAVFGIHMQNILIQNSASLENIILDLQAGKDKETSKQKFIDTLFELAKCNSTTLNFESAGMTKKNFEVNFAKPMIDNIEKAIFDPALQEKPINEILIQLFSSARGENKDIYSETVMDVIFKIGEFGSITEKVATLFTGTISNLVSGVLNVLKMERFTVIDMACKKLHDHLGTKEAVKNLLRENRTVTDLSQERLERELKDLGALIHDIAMERLNASTTSWWWTFVPQRAAVKALIGHDSTKIENLLRRLINKLAHHEILNANLYFQLQDLALAILREANRQVNANQTLGPRMIKI